MAAPPGTRQQALANATSSETANLKIDTTAKRSLSCLWWRGGQGGDHYSLLFKAPNVARLETLILFRPRRPRFHQDPATQLRKSMNLLCSLGREMTPTDLDLCCPGFQFGRNVWLATHRKPTRFLPVTVHRTWKAMPANVQDHVKLCRRDLP